MNATTTTAAARPGRHKPLRACNAAIAALGICWYGRDRAYPESLAK